MINFFKALIIITLGLLMMACGGGGGNPGASTGNSATGVSTSVTTATPTLTLGVYNATGSKVPSIDLAGAYVARATVLDGLGVAVPSRKVMFTLSDATIATLSVTTALTNSAGLAEVPIAPVSVTARGAVTLSATAVVGTATAVTGSFDFAVANAKVTLSSISAANTSIVSGGNTSLTVTALLGGVQAGSTTVNVTYVASCGRINGSASSVSVTTNGSGVAATDYSSVAADGSLCAGAVTITASTIGATASTIVLNVASPTANAVTFVSAAPAQIFVAGSGAIEQSVVKFKILSSAGTPLSGVAITFSLQVNPGGVGVNSSGSTVNIAATSDSTGFVTVAVFSGTIPGPLKVRAALTATPTVFGETQNLSVSSGPPSQRFMSLSVQTNNIEGWAVDGTATVLTVRLADRQGNPVQDGTVVNFTAEGGQVASSCTTAQVNGISLCSVNFISQNPKPANGRISILAFTNGTKDYVDVDGNNRYDAGIDTLYLIGDAYRDDNENSIYDAGEFLIPRSGAVSCIGTGWDARQSSTVAGPSRVDTCDTLLATTVRQQAVLFFSSSEPFFSSSAPTYPVVAQSLGSIDLKLASKDNPLLPMPAGTTVTAANAGTSSCAVTSVAGSPIVNVFSKISNPSEDLATFARVFLSTCVTGDVINIKITAPLGLVTTFSVKL